MDLRIIIEKVNGDISVPIGEEVGSLQMRSDGIMLNGELHFWEEIMFAQITNRELLDKLKAKPQEGR